MVDKNHRISKDTLILFCVIGVSLYALYLRIAKLSHHSLWGDEFFQLRTMEGSFLDMLKIFPTQEYCPYLSGDYYLTYPFFKLFGFNKWGLAIPHIISTVLGFYFLYLICRIYLKTVLGYLITFGVVCFNATLIWHATEIRTYAVLPTLALATFYFAHLLMRPDNMLSPAKKFAISAFFLMVIWFHLYGILMPCLSVLFLLWTIRKEAYFRRICLRSIKLLLIVFIIAMPLWFYSVFGKHAVIGPDLRIDTFLYIPNPLQNIIAFLKGIFGNLVGYNKFYFLLAGMFFPFFMKNNPARFHKLMFVFLLVFIPIGLIFLADLKNQYYFVQRQFIWTMPLFAFYLGWEWDSLFRNFRIKSS